MRSDARATHSPSLPSPARGRGAGGEGSQAYSLQHAIELLHDFVVPESQNAVTSLTQPGIALVVMFGLRRVLSAVHLDDEPALVTDEIDDVAAQGFWRLNFKPMKRCARR